MRLKCPADADSLEEAGEQLFTFKRAALAVEERAQHDRLRATERGVQAAHLEHDHF